MSSGQSSWLGWGSEVISWTRLSLFTIVTRDPTGTVSVRGLAPVALTVMVSEGLGVVGPVGCVGELPPPHELASAVRIATTTAWPARRAPRRGGVERGADGGAEEGERGGFRAIITLSGWPRSL